MAEDLRQEDIEVAAHPTVETALIVTRKERRVQTSKAFQAGDVELQDAASQAIAQKAPVNAGDRILDYCAGGGGKTLAMAAQTKARFAAHDIHAQRLAPLKDRAKRAGVDVSLLQTKDLPKQPAFDGVFCDVPCSGSGAWRRSPEGKWALTEESLSTLRTTQAEILKRATSIVDRTGWVFYATCSFLAEENEQQVQDFLDSHPGWSCEFQEQLLPDAYGDGFFGALLVQSS